MIRMFTAVFGAAFFVVLGGLSVAPDLMLGAYQDDFVAAWKEAGVDTSACDKSVPQLGIGVRDCYKESIKSLAQKIQEGQAEAFEEATRYEPAGD